MKKLFTWIVCCLLLTTMQMNGATLYLVSNNGTGWTGQTTVNTGFATVTAVNLSSPSQSLNTWYAGITFVTGDNVWVLNGTYSLSTTLALKAFGKIYGGFLGNETSVGGRQKNTDPWDFKYPTVIDGGAPTNPFQGITAGSSTLIIDGFTVQNCKYTGTANASAAGISANTTTTIQNCIVTNCTSACASGTLSGGSSAGVALSSGAKLLNSYIHDNTFTTGGGSISYAGAAVSIVGNASYSYASVTAPISGCKITYNTTSAGGQGGGLFLYSATADGFKNLEILNCNISNNSTIGVGGAASIYYTNVNNTSNTTPLIFLGCTFNSNSAQGSNGGAGIFINNSTTSNTNNNFLIQNCNFTNNTAATAAPAVTHGSAMSSNSNVTLNNCIIASNIGSDAILIGNVSGVSATINNCTFASNVNLVPSPVIAFYSNIPVTASTITNTIFYNQTTAPINAST